MRRVPIVVSALALLPCSAPAAWFDTTQDQLGCGSHEACNPVGVFLALQKSGSVNQGNT